MNSKCVYIFFSLFSRFDLNYSVEKRRDMIAVFLFWKSIWLDCVTDQRYTKAIKTLIWLVYSFSLTLFFYHINPHHINTQSITLTVCLPNGKSLEWKKKSMCFRSKREIKGKTVRQLFSSFALALSLSHSLPFKWTDTHTHTQRETGTNTYIQLFGEITRRQEGKLDTKEFCA